MYNYIFFDFDGTLFDTSEGVFKSFDRVVEHYHIQLQDRSIYNTMIGPPLRESFTRVFHFAEAELAPAMAVYREYYQQQGMFEVRAYDGIVDCIRKLRAAGRKVYVATSKPELYARRILERQGMLPLFDFVGGSDLAEKERVNKVDIINYVLDSEQLSGKKAECVMVGDTRFDMEGAAQAGLDTIGVLYGFGSRESLEQSGAKLVVQTPADVAQAILGQGEDECGAAAI